MVGLKKLIGPAITLTLAELVGVEGSRSGTGCGTYQRAFLSIDNGAHARAGRGCSGDSQFIAVLLPEGAGMTPAAYLNRFMPRAARRQNLDRNSSLV